MNLSVDLHGMRVDQALRTLERHLKACFAAKSPVAHVVHGHGSGALKQAVRDYLRDSPLVDKFYAAGYGQGGDGVTIAELNDGDRHATRKRSHNMRPLPPPDRR